jgi:hypothetical protein
MSDAHVMNVSGGNIFEAIWVEILFVPLIIIYTNILLLFNQLIMLLEHIEWIGNINLILGYGLDAIILFGVNFAAKNSKNDFIAGPVETLNIYTFFFLGISQGGIQLAIIFLALYEILETIGLPLVTEAITKNELAKAMDLGITKRRFILYTYIFAPLATLASMLLSYILLKNFVPVEQWINGHVAYQIKYLTYHLALWVLIYHLLHWIYYKYMEDLGCSVFPFVFSILFATYLLSEQWYTWILYILLLLGGWSMMFVYISHSIQVSKEVASEDEFTYINWRRRG